MTRPVLALAATRHGVPDGVLPLVRALSHWAAVRTLDEAGDEATALLATAPRALHRVGASATGLPCAVWVSDDDELATLADAWPGVVLTDDPHVAVAARARGFDLAVLPRPTFDVHGLEPAAPLVRARWRERLALPADLVIRMPVAATRVAPHAAVAAVVIGTGLAALEPLALGAPVVTDAATAARLGADGGEVVVATPDEADAVAAGLAQPAAAPAAARLSRLGRALAERHAVGPVAAALAAHLGLATPVRPFDPRARLEARINELGAPTHGPLRARARAALEAFPTLPPPAPLEAR